MTCCLGIDIGGTAVKLGLVALGKAAAGNPVLAGATLPFRRDQPLPALARSIAAACLALEAEAGARGVAVGVATPGFTDAQTGILVDGGGNVPALREGSLRGELARLLDRRVVVENDGTAATLAELRFGAGRAFRRFALVTIGTGIGGGLAIDGRVVTGNRGEPAEFGAMVLDAAGPPNQLGLRGTFERYAAIGAFQAAYVAHGGAAPLHDLLAIFASAKHDDAAAMALDTVCRRIAQGAGMLINACNLEAVVIGGGVSAAGEDLLGRVRQHLPLHTWPMLLRNVQLRSAALANDAGVVGAALLAGDCQSSDEHWGG